MTDSKPQRIHVVAGILSDAAGRVLVAQRPHGKHLAGDWEFPGGKVEPGETARAALQRELFEELGIRIGAIEPLIGVPWQYAHKSIFLDVYKVLDFTGMPHGSEGQAIEWRQPDQLADLNMPAADRPIVTALRLPPFYAITPEPGDDDDAFLAHIERMLADGIRLIQLRAKSATPARLQRLVIAAHERVRAANGNLLLNGHIDLVRQLDLDGIHLPASELMQLMERPLSHRRWVAASCHDGAELDHAAAIGIDFAVLGPVAPTPSHPGAAALGWSQFAQLCADAPLPIYALGGLRRTDLATAKMAGARGIAGISAFWSG